MLVLKPKATWTDTCDVLKLQDLRQSSHITYLNRYMWCIEMINVTQIIQILQILNRYMWCIEIEAHRRLVASSQSLNRYMWCIEIQIRTGSFLSKILLEPIHVMYWNKDNYHLNKEVKRPWTDTCDVLKYII
jgi:hypothetical protein